MQTSLIHHAATAQAMQLSAVPMSGSSSSSGSSSDTDTSTISGNDFLTLLVTELQNQDPTADTDPNEYVNQLVSVNSLEQLIDINQTLSSATSSTTSTTGSAVSAQAPPANAGHATAQNSSQNAAAASAALPVTNGNLNVPPPNPSAQRVAHALNGQTSH